MFASLLIAGEDRGQLRPGLAAAKASGTEIVTLNRPRPLPTVEVAAAPAIGSLPATAEAKIVPAVAAVAVTPEPAVERVRRSEPVFTLSALPSLGGDQVTVDDAVMTVPAEAGEIYVVTANSVNVRGGPSTANGVVGKLHGGEEVRVLSPIDSDWVEVVIEGDGMRGYVASRFLAVAR